MGIYFTTTQPADFYRSGCPWDRTEYDTREEAYRATEAHYAEHGHDGCTPAQAFLGPLDGETDEEFSARWDAARDRLGERPDECVGYICTSGEFRDEPPSMGLSNANAYDVLRTLGLCETRDPDTVVAGLSDRDPLQTADDVQLAGTEPVEQFRGRVLLALAVAPTDTGIPSRSRGGDGYATIVDCGRAPGYLQERLGQLLTLCDHAARGGHDIIWS